VVYVINARNVNDAYALGMDALGLYGLRVLSRAGNTLEYPGPVVTVYERPTERVLFDEHRDANPFFHFMESLWMLAGRRDVAFIKHFNKRMDSYSDNGTDFHGAYGYRWRKHFDLDGGGASGLPDQLDTVVRELSENPYSRRAVVAMWDPVADLGGRGKDLPCNTHIYFKLRRAEEESPAALDMTVCNRSNDIIWGCYGANAVHLSMLQEYMAARLNSPVGIYTQISDSWHAYVDVFAEKTQPFQPRACPYELGQVTHRPMVENPSYWDKDLKLFLEEGGQSAELYYNPFFLEVATPIWWAWDAYQRKEYSAALNLAEVIKASDWRRACVEWLRRRKGVRDAGL
jgi:thymidylate synthase